MKKILFITNSLGFGGAEKMLAYVANSLSERGYEVGIVNLNNVPDYVNMKQQTVTSGIKVYSVKQLLTGRKNKIYMNAIVSAAKEMQANILIGFTSFPNTYAVTAGKLLHISSIISERGDPNRTFGNGIKDRICKCVINHSTGGVFQTDGAKAFYGKHLQKNGTVIPNPIFINGKLPDISFSEREKTVVSVGRLDNFQKRYDVMLDSFKLFSERHPEYVLKLYGRGIDEEKIKEWAEERGLKEKVRFMGLTAQPMLDIARDGMFLITSDYEGISNSLLEAMAVGLPCVSTDHTPGGARLLIQNGENGLLAPMGDTHEIASAMCRFAEDSALAQRCGENARRVTERFAPERIIDMWEAYILKICGNKK